MSSPTDRPTLGALFLINLFHWIDNAMMVLFHITALKQADLTLVVIVSIWLLCWSSFIW